MKKSKKICNICEKKIKFFQKKIKFRSFPENLEVFSHKSCEIKELNFLFSPLSKEQLTALGIVEPTESKEENNYVK